MSLVYLTLADTTRWMESDDYKERFKAEYYQTKYRYQQLRLYNAKIEAALMECEAKKPEMPPHDCPACLLIEQEYVMENYLHILEVRAAFEGIDL